MAQGITLAIVSDLHYACLAEQSRGRDYEFQHTNSLARCFLSPFLRRFWLAKPMHHNNLLDEFIRRADGIDYVIANGDYSCDSQFVGVSDDAAFQSTYECLKKLRDKFGNQFYATLGDHEIGKVSLVGKRGGMRLASYYRACQELALKPYWRFDLGQYVLIGITSSLVGFPILGNDALPLERTEWESLRRHHLAQICSAFSSLTPEQRVLLFCHDPTALKFLWDEAPIRRHCLQIERTIIGHLHSQSILSKSQMLAGMPVIHFLGDHVKSMTMALHYAQCWKSFRVQLCPSLAGIEMLKDGGFLSTKLGDGTANNLHFEIHRITR